MIDQIANEIHVASMSYNTPVVLGAAIAFTGGGLMVWLAGLGMGRIASITIGAFFGCIAGYICKPYPALLLLFGAFIGALCGLGCEIIASKIFGFASTAYNLILSATSSFSGTLSLFLGIILLLSLKGTAPLSKIIESQQFYLTVAGVMFAFGLIEQLLICKKPYQTVAQKVSNKKTKRTGDSEKKESWRNT